LSYSSFCIAIHDLTLFIGLQEEHLACKKVALVWLSVWREVQTIAYGPADANATASSLASLKSKMFYLSGASLPGLTWKEVVK